MKSIPYLIVYAAVLAPILGILAILGSMPGFDRDLISKVITAAVFMFIVCLLIMRSDDR